MWGVLMKSMVCEMCGSNDVMKQDGYYVCQHCGTRYTVEEARKLIVEGTVKIDNTDFVKKYLDNAHRAMKKHDWAEAEKYYNLVESNEPDNWEAVFYSAYAKVMALQTDIPHIVPALEVLAGSMDQVIFQVEKMPNDEEAVQLTKFSDELHELTSKLVENAHQSGERDEIQLSMELIVRGALAKVHFAFGDELEKTIEKYDVAKKLIAQNYKTGINYTVRPFVANGQFLSQHNDTTTYNTANNNNAALKDKYLSKLTKYDTSYTPPSTPGGCYVATAVYGSYDCPQVWTLRRFRDNTLAETWYGRAFIHTYYAISPTLVKWFGKTQWFKNMWKPTLDKMVTRLNEQGVEATPYMDRNW